MQYRKFGKLDWKVSALGFGAMRLPTIGGDANKVDEALTISMIRKAIDGGVNYLDTAYMYHNGMSERVVGRALKDGYREKMRLATKFPARMAQTATDFDRIFNDQLEKLQVQKIDFYLMHGLGADSWAKVRDLGVIKWAENQMAKGKFDHFGFSFHDSLDAFKGIINDYDNWTFCQIQYNYMDAEFQAGRKGVEFAADKGLGIVVMEPNRGGKLAKKPPDAVSKVWEASGKKRTPVDWAMSWVWNQPEISLALSGMSNMAQVEENLALANRAKPGMLTSDDLKTIEKAKDAYRKLIPISCTSCRYCMPCPNGVDIPGIFALYNDAMMYDDVQSGAMRYRSPMGIKEDARADKCLECGDCMEACPQKIDVPDWMKKVDMAFAPKK